MSVSVANPPDRSEERSLTDPWSFVPTGEPWRFAALLLIVSSLSEFLLRGRWHSFPLALGLALLITEDELRALVWRFWTFVLGVVMLMPHVPTSLNEALYEAQWDLSARIFLFAGSVLGLLFESLPRPAVAILTLLGFGALFIPGYALL